MERTEKQLEELQGLINSEVLFSRPVDIRPTPHRLILSIYGIRNHLGDIQYMNAQSKWIDLHIDIDYSEMVIQTIWQRIKSMKHRNEL